jgi:cyclin B
MATRTGFRNILGDITKQQNIPRKVALVDAKVTTRQAAATKKLTSEVVSDSHGDQATERSLPAGVVDIDEKDLENPQLCAEYTQDMYAYLRTVEPLSAVKANHLVGCSINEKMRAVLVDWLVEVQIQFKLLQETLFSTISIVDRFLAVEGLSITRSKLQLVGVAAMFLASKVEEVYAPACSDFVYITDHAYTEDAIKQMEMKILQTLKFSLFEPLSIHFLRRYSKAGDVDVLQHSLAKYALELALVEYELVPVPGSKLAASALCLALILLEPQEKQTSVWGETLVYYSGYSKEELMSTVSRLAKTISSSFLKSNKTEAIRNKYRGAKFMKVADLPELKGEVLSRLVARKR